MTVVSNTSPLLNLALIERLPLVEAQFGEVVVPTAVWNELTAGFDGRDRIEAFRDRGGMRVVSPEPTELRTEFERELDRGEAAAIAYAIDIDADRVLIDEREGRATATRHDVPVTGVVGILLRASSRGDVDLEAELDALREAGFWISGELYERALEIDAE
jgi:predicted nucleic acid-binding protein